jgi:CTP:molybdopterin cytidylyltransferase MocA
MKRWENMNFYFLILAAGNSSRMKGIHKGTISIKGNPLLISHINNIKKCKSINSINIVCSPENVNIYKDLITKYYGDLQDINFIINENNFNGMFSSVLEGTYYYNTNTYDGLFIGNVDCSIQIVTIENIIKSYKKLKSKSLYNNNISIIPDYEGKKGHPIFLTNSVVTELKQASIDNRLDLWLENNTNIYRMPVYNKSVIMNINLPSELRKWQEYLNNME